MQRYGITVPFDGIPLADQRDLFAELPDLCLLYTSDAADE